MIDWKNIDTAFLVMDCTLLDLAYEYWFWLQPVPAEYAKAKNLAIEQALEIIRAWINRHHGTLNWYCLDFWSVELSLTIAALKQQTGDRIALRPGPLDFHRSQTSSGRRAITATNAPRDALHVNLAPTGIPPYFAALVAGLH